MELKFCDVTYEVERARLRVWLRLEFLQSSIREAVGANIADLLCEYVSTALRVSKTDVVGAPWFEVAYAFKSVYLVNTVSIDIPLLRRPSKEHTDEPWEYDERDWYVWAHTLAREFGWSLEYIAELDVEDAFKLSQEILLDRQFQREWEWMLSDRAFTYDPNLGRSRVNELPRPPWMQAEIDKQPETVRIPRAMMPVGVKGVSFTDEDIKH